MSECRVGVFDYMCLLRESSNGRFWLICPRCFSLNSFEKNTGVGVCGNCYFSFFRFVGFFLSGRKPVFDNWLKWVGFGERLPAHVEDEVIEECREFFKHEFDKLKNGLLKLGFADGLCKGDVRGRFIYGCRKDKIRW